MPKITKARGAHIAGYPIGIVRVETEPQDGPVEATVGERPAKKAPKDDWVVYAEAHGYAVDGLTKDQIIERIDEQED